MVSGDQSPPSVRGASVFWVLLLLIGIGLTYYLASSSVASVSAIDEQGKTVAATVNGENISEEALLEEILVTHGPAVLNDMVRRRLIRQAAREHGLRLSGDELLDVDERVKNNPNWKVARDRIETQLLLRKLALADVTDKEKREAFEVLKEELTLYELRVADFASPESAQAFFEAYNGTGAFESFETLALQHCPKDSVPKALGKFTAGDIKRAFAAEVASLLLALEEGRVSRPVKDSGGTYYVYRLDRIYDDYLELEREIGTVLARERAPRVMQRLLEEAEVKSPYLPKEEEEEAQATSGPPADS